MIELVEDEAAMARIDPADLATLTEAATGSTFYAEGLTVDQIAANRRVVEISAETCLAAMAAPNQRFVAAFHDGEFGGYVIATVHDPGDRELDWLMVHPDYHGSEVAPALMRAGIDWLGVDSPQWLSVIRHNHRAIGFYRKFGFEIDPAARTSHVVPHVVMRRKAT